MSNPDAEFWKAKYDRQCADLTKVERQNELLKAEIVWARHRGCPPSVFWMSPEEGLQLVMMESDHCRSGHHELCANADATVTAHS